MIARIGANATFPPLLSVGYTNGKVRVSWPVSAKVAGFILQQTNELPASLGNWSVVPELVCQTEGSEVSAIFLLEERTQFFRLTRTSLNSS